MSRLQDRMMRDHWWWRPGWRVGRRAYTFHITFDDDDAVLGSAELRRLAAEYQRALASTTGMDLVPPRWLHLTMQNVGFTDEVAHDTVEAVLAAARDACREQPPFELRFEAAEVRREAIALRPSPAVAVARLRDAVRSAIARVLGAVPEAPEHTGGFEPHVSLAYSSGNGPADPFVQALASVCPASANVIVRAAKLIVLDRDERVYRWETYGAVPLAG